MAMYKINFAVALFGLYLTLITCRLLNQYGALNVLKQTSLFISIIALLLGCLQLGGYPLDGYVDNLQTAAGAKKYKELRIGMAQGIPLYILLIIASIAISYLYLERAKNHKLIIVWWGGFWTSIYVAAIGATPIPNYFLYMMLSSLAFGGYLYYQKFPLLLRLSAISFTLLILTYVGFLSIWQFTFKVMPTTTNGYDVLSANRLQYISPSDNQQEYYQFSFDDAKDTVKIVLKGNDVSTHKITEAEEIYQYYKNSVNNPVVTFMDYVNYSSFYYSNPQPSILNHWKHLHYTMSNTDFHLLKNELDTSNIVLIPVYFYEEMHLFPMCWFLTSSPSDSFEYVRRTDHWNVFIRKESMNVPIPPLNNMIDLKSSPHIQDHCERIKKVRPLIRRKLFIYDYIEIIYDFFVTDS